MHAFGLPVFDGGCQLYAAHRSSALHVAQHSADDAVFVELSQPPLAESPLFFSSFCSAQLIGGGAVRRRCDASGGGGHGPTPLQCTPLQ